MSQSMRVDLLYTPENPPPPPPGFFVFLWRSGLLRHMLAALPMLLAGAGVLVIAGAAAMADPDQVRSRYFDHASRLFQARDYEAARIGFERVAEWDGAGGEREVRYNLAVCLDALGEHDRAAAMIGPMAPEDRPGYAPAHVWKATRLWSGSGHTPADIRDGEKHLLFAYKENPDSIEVNALLGQFYLAGGRVDRALPFLEKAARDRPVLLLPLARASLAHGDETTAREWALLARRIFRERAEANLEDHEARLLWADADLVLEDFPGAVNVLQREADLKLDGRFPRALAHVYMAWSDAQAKKAPTNLVATLALLERGLAHDSANITLLDRFSRLIRGGGTEGDRARGALQDLVARGVATGPVRYALGLDAWENDRAVEARLLWEQACRLSPQIPAFANNLAWITATGPDPDLPRALAIINPVLERFPGDLRVRETRGEILIRMQRWKEALPDLEAALVAYPDKPELHRALADTYKHLDAPGLAAAHRMRAVVNPPSPKTEPDPQSPRASARP